ncbi:conserved hypothetical protein [Talaromyces stipitatus ATCC 10500]|uniref:Copper-fist domain-containing protein n=1 Tax=Talaromyces stipitatus (strain ATCC 10500 / CBS 375.48 / QM 6759 / NRRL 1006) TaxID=441959 RepID=B8MT81_TALSN|nr:uncharacterized protein TSTA_002440 [Talaromyces stipitatus ATCC 10500]EED12178.1 conserved hypothetical protein [Talaromyces stipitatus ATCC 10500]
MLIDGEKWACEACVRGHRVSSCRHHDRPLIRINKKGRPFSVCIICRGPCNNREEHSKLNRDKKSDGESDSKSSKVLRKRQHTTPLVALYPYEAEERQSPPLDVESSHLHLHALHHILHHSRLQPISAANFLVQSATIVASFTANLFSFFSFLDRNDDGDHEHHKQRLSTHLIVRSSQSAIRSGFGPVEPDLHAGSDRPRAAKFLGVSLRFSPNDGSADDADFFCIPVFRRRHVCSGQWLCAGSHVYRVRRHGCSSRRLVDLFLEQ